MLFRILLILFCLLGLGFNAHAQSFGGFKPSKMWFFSNKENIRIVYSQENKNLAFQTSSIVEQLNALDSNIGPKRRNINIVLQNSTIQANGYVGITPFVSEFFLTPYPNSFAIGSLPWTYTLGIHEYQHVLQFANSYYGISKIAYWIGGGSAWSTTVGLSVPNWFFEGDAVRAETEYTHQGRGRIPYFINGFRAYAKKEQFPHYFKARSGSIQDFVPNHYPLGYLMIAYGRERFGESFWQKILQEAVSYKGIFYPFSRALKRNTGMYSKAFYDSTMTNFTKVWSTSEEEKKYSIKTFIPENTTAVAHYNFPQFSDDSTLIFHYSSYDKIGRFFSCSNGILEKHRPLGFSNERYFSVYKNKVIFTQVYFDTRWGWIDYNDLIIYDLITKKSNRLTQKQKYFHPSFSPGGEKIVVLEVPINSHYQLRILDANNGNTIQTVKNQHKHYFTYPTWLNDNQIIAASRDSIGQMAITLTDVQTGKTENLSPWSYHIIGKPQLKNNKVYYSATYSGIDNLFELDINSRLISQLTSDGLGKYQVSTYPNEDSLLFTEFSLNGYKLKSAHIKDLSIETIEEVVPLKRINYYHKNFFSATEIIPTYSTDSTLEAKKYGKYKSFLNIHSWEISPLHPNYRFGVESENILNTFDLEAAYTYNANEQRGGYDIDFKFGQYYLNLEGNFAQQNRSFNSRFLNQIEWNEIKSEFGFSLPLNLSSNIFSRRLNLFSYYTYTVADYDLEILNNLSFHGTHLGWQYRQERLKARKNIFTHLGIYTRLSHKLAFTSEQYDQTLFQSSFALPGIRINHNLLIDADFQLKDRTSLYQYRDNFVYERGSSFRIYDELFKTSFNYHFPIFYPDKGAIGLVFLQRIRGNLFFDLSKQDDKPKQFYSSGAELIFDVKLLHEYFLSFGIRYTRVIQNPHQSVNGNGSSTTNDFELFIPLSRF